MSTRPAARPAPAYEDDFYAWTRDQAEKLSARRHNEIDWDNLSEEIDSVGRSDKRSIGSNLNVVLVHLLKWAYQPGKRKGGWASSIIEHRDRLRRILDDSPSLRNFPADSLAIEYASARKLVAAQTGIPLADLPAACPFSIEQVLADDFPADLHTGFET